MRAGERVASIDIGSNTVLMLVAERSAGGGWRRVDDLATITRISEGLDQSGRLDEAPIARTEAVLSDYADRAESLGARTILATGTAPFRRSANGDEVAGRLGDTLGAALDIVSGEDEAAVDQIVVSDRGIRWGRLYREFG